MDAGAFNRSERFNGTRQFAFQRTLVIHLFAKLADTKFFLVQQFKTHRAAFRQTLLGQTQTQFMDFIRGNFDGAASLGETIGHVHLRQLGDDGAPVLIGEVAEQRAVIWRFGPQYHRHDDRDGSRARHNQRDSGIRTQAI